jgi:hypothetical protein
MVGHFHHPSETNKNDPIRDVSLLFPPLEMTMNILKNLLSPPRPAGKFYPFSVRCKRCGEIIQGQVNVNNEPSLELDEKGKPFYTCRKVMIGNGHCFQQIEVVFTFDESRRVLDQKISNGEFVED